MVGASTAPGEDDERGAAAADPAAGAAPEPAPPGDPGVEPWDAPTEAGRPTPAAAASADPALGDAALGDPALGDPALDDPALDDAVTEVVAGGGTAGAAAVADAPTVLAAAARAAGGPSRAGDGSISGDLVGPTGVVVPGARTSADVVEPAARSVQSTPSAADGAGDPVVPGGSRRGRLAGRTLRGVGELLITGGVLVLLFLVYQLWITDIFAARTQDRLHQQLDQAWAHPPAPAPAPDRVRPAPAIPPVDIGSGLAVLRIPRFGVDYSPVIVEGVSAADLRRGPGHIPGTALPGQVGNFVVSGHRTTYGKPFSRLDELKVGDPLIVEVRDRYYTYRVTSSEVVTPNRLDVTYPVPGKPGVAPTKELITLTTCHPKFSASHRLIVYGELVDTTDKADGPPPAIEGE